MSVSRIGSSAYDLYRTQIQSVQKDFSNLKTDLASGDLATAQTAYTTLQQDLSSIQGNQTGTNNEITTNLTALGQALDSNDLSGAQKAFATLQQDMQAGHVHGHHHHHPKSGQNKNVVEDLDALGSALQSNDLSGAQKAFATLQQDMGSSGTQSTTVSSATPSSASTSSLLDYLQAASSSSSSASPSISNTLFRALSQYGQMSLGASSLGLFSLMG